MEHVEVTAIKQLINGMYMVRFNYTAPNMIRQGAVLLNSLEPVSVLEGIRELYPKQPEIQLSERINSLIKEGY